MAAAGTRPACYVVVLEGKEDDGAERAPFIQCVADADRHDQSHEHREGHIRRFSLANEEVIHLKADPA